MNDLNSSDGIIERFEELENTLKSHNKSRTKKRKERQLDNQGEKAVS